MIDAQKNAGTRCHSRFLLTRNKFLPSNIAAFSLVVLSTLLPASQTPAFAAHPACSSASFDSDGDGWGWENNRTCVVATQATPPTNTGTVNLPLCTNADSDHDGDGFGWEQSASCIVAASSMPTNLPSPTDDTVESTIPACIDAASDPDGDGYGWEDDRSCLVVTTASPPQSAPAEPADPTNEQQATRPQGTTADSLRFIAMGDSITHGVTRNSAKSYRHDLTDLLDAAGCRYTMVGSQQTNLGHRTFVSPHEGYNGHRADHFLTGLNNFAGNNEGVSVAMNRLSPNLVLLHLGTNDMLQNQNVADTVAEIDQIISIILDAGADVLVANVIPVFGFSAQTRTQQLGDQLQRYVNQLGNSRVRIVDVRSGFTNAMMLSDNLHPNTAGEAHIARAFFNAVQNAGKCVRP